MLKPPPLDPAARHQDSAIAQYDGHDSDAICGPILSKISTIDLGVNPKLLFDPVQSLEFGLDYKITVQDYCDSIPVAVIRPFIHPVELQRSRLLRHIRLGSPGCAAGEARCFARAQAMMPWSLLRNRQAPTIHIDRPSSATSLERNAFCQIQSFPSLNPSS
jgi:hypothetical protein